MRQEVLLERLRRPIVEGKLLPGQRLPAQTQLVQEFGASPVTVERAFRQLVAMGFARSQRGVGTFVADHPPHLCRYAMVFPTRRDGFEFWTSFWVTLQHAAATVVRAEPQKQIVFYYGISGHADVEDYQRLMADVRARRLAGIIFLSPPHVLQNSPLLDDCPVPRVFIGNDGSSQWKIPGIAPDYHSFVDRALEHAARQSRRRPVFVGPDITDAGLWQQVWFEACHRHGIEPAPWQLLSTPLTPMEATRHLAQVLMKLPPAERPDTLVVADDHFVEEVTAGLLASNLPSAELPMVIAHANFPRPPIARLPVTFLGFDSARIVCTCLDVLDAERRGHATPQSTPIPATFAFEQTDGGELFTDSVWEPRDAAAIESAAANLSHVEMKR